MPRLCLTAIALALLAAGCGGKQHVDRYADVQACFAKLGLVGVEPIHFDRDSGDKQIAIETATISYRSPGSGAREAWIVFYANKRQRKTYMKATPGRPAAIAVGSTAGILFPTSPSPAQRAQLLACFD